MTGERGKTVLARHYSAETMADFNMVVPSVQMAHALLEKASALTGVEETHIEFLRERHESYGVLREMVDAKAAELEAS